MDFSLILAGLLLPFAGTVFGSACVFFMRKQMKRGLRGVLCGFAAGVMMAASIWSLLIPALENPNCVKLPAWFPATAGFYFGIWGLLLIDHTLQKVDNRSGASQKDGVHGDRMLLLAVTLHNLPEGMAVGAAIAACLFGSGEVSRAAVIALSVGIGLQNFPEGAIVSMPLHASGMKKTPAFAAGSLSGMIEPIGGLLMLAAAECMLPVLPYLLGFAAGAMIYVVLEELLPEMQECLPPQMRVLSFSVGFVCMMLLDFILSA